MNRLYTFILAIVCWGAANAQTGKEQLIKSSALDTTVKAKPLFDSAANTPLPDTPKVNLHEPRKATIRALIFPGLGQIYNRQYWKVPLAWAAVGIPAGFFFYNNAWYQRTKKAYVIVVNGETNRYNEIYAGLKNKYTGQPLDAESLRIYRNQFRQDRDYAVLYFLLGYALQVVDATVSGHLKHFDISEDLSMDVQPSFNPMFKAPGISLAFNFKSAAPKKTTSW